MHIVVTLADTPFLNTKIIISTERTLSAAWFLMVLDCGLEGWGDGFWLDDEDECCGASGDDLSMDWLSLDCCKMIQESLSSSSRDVYCNPDFTFVGLCGSERLVFTSSSLIKFRVWLLNEKLVFNRGYFFVINLQVTF